MSDSSTQVQWLRSFKPVGAKQARILILGSMPGVASLNKQQYYAHPRNAFWPVMLAIVDDQPASYDAISNLGYRERLDAIEKFDIALWDVIAQCIRPGSLDASIQKASVVAQDFCHYFEHQPLLEKILFNGKAAESLFKKHALPQLKEQQPERLATLSMTALPSTSPAMASLSLSQKHNLWCEAIGPLTLS